MRCLHARVTRVRVRFPGVRVWSVLRVCCCGRVTRFGAAPAPVDGVVRLPLRLLDAPAAPEACGNATTPVCTLQDTAAASYSASRIACAVSPGVGAGFQLLIRDVWTALVSNGVRVGYRPPQVTAVSPDRLPVGGGNVTVVGSGFGPDRCDGANRTSDVRLLVTAAPDPAGLQPVYDAATGTWGPSGAIAPAFAPCDVLSWGPTAIVCAAPPGLDASVAVRVNAGGQAVTAGVRTGYAPPVVAAGRAGGGLAVHRGRVRWHPQRHDGVLSRATGRGPGGPGGVHTSADLRPRGGHARGVRRPGGG